MKRINHLFEHVINWEHLYNSFCQAMKGTGKTDASCKFFFYYEKEISRLQKELSDESYQPGRYHFFKINDPKQRIIAVAPFRDRVVHHAIISVLTPIYEKCFIYDSYATRKNKGTHLAICKSQQFMRQSTWYLKSDIEKFFDSVDHDIMMYRVKRNGQGC